MGKTLKKVLVAVGLAGLAGYVAGLLTAPQSGKETRADLKEAAARGMTEGERQLKQAVSELGDLTDQLRRRAAELGDKAGKEAAELADKARQARDKAREVLSAIHEGDAEDKDLQTAIKQANDALKHLKAYLQK